MARTTRKSLEQLLAFVSRLGAWPAGPYPTHGQLVLDDTGTGRYQVSIVCQGTSTTCLSQCLTASEMDAYLRGMIAAYDTPRFRQHWQLPTAQQEAA